MKKQIRLAAAVLVAALVAVPMFAARGSADFTRFVALGDSYGAGYSNNSLNEHHQPWSWPAIIARQAGVPLCAVTAVATDPCFAQPLVSYPGLGPELQLVNLAPTITPAPGMGSPLMLSFARPYNNLSVPGATVGALLTITGAEQPSPLPAAQFVLRGQGTAVQQAAALHPTFVAIWIGGNDYLNVVGTGTPATMTSVADFKTRYEAMLDALIAAAPNSGMVVGNLPASVIPYLKLVPPFLVDPATRQPILNPATGQPIFFIADDGSGNVAPIAADTLLPLSTREKIAQGYGLPAFLKAVPPFNQLPHVGEPLKASDVLTAQEIAQVFARVAEYNAVISQAAAARNIPVADVNALFQRVNSQAGIQLGPINVNGNFITGGFFALDGVHLTDLGYLLFADEYIKAINSAYQTEIPLASITQLFANNGANFDEGFENLSVQPSADLFSSAAIQQIQNFWAQPTMHRLRAAHH